MYFCGAIIGVSLIFIGDRIFSVFQNEPDGEIVGLFLVCVLGIPLILMGFLFFQLIITSIAQFFSYVQSSASGLEYRFWPYQHIRCSWPDVEKLGKHWLFIDAVYLKRGEVIGRPIAQILLPKEFLSYSQEIIPLAGYSGWPDGQLAKDLQRYAPHLFSEDTTNPPLIAETETQPGPSQEERLLAALSHIAILFSALGIIVPAVIWVTQREKSPYTAHQALQALVFQGVAILVSLAALAFFICSLLGVFASVFPEAGNEPLGEIIFGLIMAVLFISVCIMSLGQLIFIWYGINAAVVTFFGKEFRYLFVGRRLEEYLAKVGK
jgi:uncharacterized Tic20 family protein